MTLQATLQDEKRSVRAPSSSRDPKPGRLRAAVIGAGKISEEHLRFLAGSPLAQIVSVCDLSPSLARYAAKKFGASRADTDLARMLDDAKPDVVHILTPPHTHAGLIGDCLRAGAHVIVEKPVATSLEEYRDLHELATSRGLRLIEDHNYRFNRPIRAIDAALAAGRLGEVREVEVRLVLNLHAKGGRYSDTNLPHPSHRLPAGVLHEFITHLGYLVAHFLPPSAMPDRVAAAWSNHAGGELFRFDDLDAIVVAGEIHARIRFSARTSPDAFSVAVRGSKGWAEVDLFQPYVRMVTSRGLGPFDSLANHVANGLALVGSGITGFGNKVLQKSPYEGLARFLGLTYDALANGGEPPVQHEDIERVIRLIDALLDGANHV